MKTHSFRRSLRGSALGLLVIASLSLGSFVTAKAPVTPRTTTLLSTSRVLVADGQETHGKNGDNGQETHGKKG